MFQFDLSSLTSTQSLYDLTNKHSYKTLYLSVIVQALLDLTKPEQEGEASHIKVHRKQADAWFFSSIGTTCEDFEQVCNQAGVSSYKVRHYAYEVIKSGDIKDVRKKFKALL
jgi:type VI protein secretion system component VasF|tara:strand:- start:495 stop:830 length:336 start_codon:yes stop_codon:yes gene_type:complete